MINTNVRLCYLTPGHECYSGTDLDPTAYYSKIVEDIESHFGEGIFIKLKKDKYFETAEDNDRFTVVRYRPNLANKEMRDRVD